MAVINSGLVPKALQPGLAGSLPAMEGPQGLPQGRQPPPPRSRLHLTRMLQKAVRGELPAAHNDGGPAFIRDDQSNAYGPPVVRTSGGSASPSQSTPIEDVLARIDRARKDADAAFR